MHRRFQADRRQTQTMRGRYDESAHCLRRRHRDRDLDLPGGIIATRASQCGDLEAFVSPQYWRGLSGESAGPYDLTAPCWLRGRLDSRPPVTTCAAGSHDVGNGGCCPDGWHGEGTKCIKDGSPVKHRRCSHLPRRLRPRAKYYGVLPDRAYLPWQRTVHIKSADWRLFLAPPAHSRARRQDP